MSDKVAKFEIKGIFPYILIFYYIKQIDSMLPCVCSVIDHRGRQNVVRTSVTHSAAPRVPLFCSYHILTSSVIYYWTDARQHGIYLLTSSSPILRIRIWSILVVFYLRTFARNFSNIDFCLKILPLKYDELVMPEKEKNWGVTDFVLERTCPEKRLNLRKSDFVSEQGHSGCRSQNIAIRALKGHVLSQIWFKWTY